MLGDLYTRAQDRFIALAAPYDDSLVINATPDWALLDLVAHLTGVAHDFVTGNVDEWAQASWTARQVTDRHKRSRRDLIDEWNALTPTVADALNHHAARGMPEAFARLPLMDLTCHEADLRESAGLPPALDEFDWSVLGKHRRAVLESEITESGVPTLTVTTPQGDTWHGGANESSITVRVDRYELWRSLMGRRTRAAVRAFEWSTDADAYLPVWVGSSFGWPEDNPSRML